MTDLEAEYVDAAWIDIQTIRHLYSRFARKWPVMLLELPIRRVYAYAFRGYRAELSPRSQALLDEQYEEAAQTGEMVVFVRDEDRRKLVSFNLPAREVKHSGPSKGAAPDRGHKPVPKNRAASRRARGA
jgi:hypothetical protein